jgi:hypothetical protein
MRSALSKTYGLVADLKRKTAARLKIFHLLFSAVCIPSAERSF